MSHKEESYDKHVILSVKDWDAYQRLLRTWTRLFRQEKRISMLPEVWRKA